MSKTKQPANMVLLTESFVNTSTYPTTTRTQCNNMTSRRQ